MALWRQHRESEIEIKLVVGVCAVGSYRNIDCIVGSQLTEPSVEGLSFFAAADQIRPRGLFVDEDAKLDVSLKIAVVPTDGAVGNRIEAVIRDGEANDGVDVERAALGFASTRMAAVSGNSDVGTGLWAGEIGIVI